MKGSISFQVLDVSFDLPKYKHFSRKNEWSLVTCLLLYLVKGQELVSHLTFKFALSFEIVHVKGYAFSDDPGLTVLG